jgi:hypothetical protein
MCYLCAQCHLAAGVKRKDLRTEAHLIVRPCAVVAAEIGLVARGDTRYWIQNLQDVDTADWDLYEEVLRQPGFKPPMPVRSAALSVRLLSPCVV